MIISQKAMALATVVGMIGRAVGAEIRTITYEATGACLGGKPMWLKAISSIEFARFSFGNHTANRHGSLSSIPPHVPKLTTCEQ
jgi:hypothetical protein